MTKKHFIALADYIREHNRIAQFNTALSKYDHGHIEGLASFCKAQNPDFNRDRWLDYVAGKCGPNGGAK